MYILYSIILMLSYVIAVRFTLVYVGLMAGKVTSFNKSNAWLHALSIAIILNDFFDIFRW